MQTMPDGAPADARATADSAVSVDAQMRPDAFDLGGDIDAMSLVDASAPVDAAGRRMHPSTLAGTYPMQARSQILARSWIWRSLMRRWLKSMRHPPMYVPNWRANLAEVVKSDVVWIIWRS